MKKIYSFEHNPSVIEAYKGLNFTDRFHDKIKGMRVYYLEADLTDYGWMSTLHVLQECQRLGLEPSFRTLEGIRDLEDAIEFANLKATEEEFFIN